METNTYTIDLKLVIEQLEKAFAQKEEDFDHNLILDGVHVYKNSTIFECGKEDYYTTFHGWFITKLISKYRREEPKIIYTLYDKNSDNQISLQSPCCTVIENPPLYGEKGKYMTSFQLKGDKKVHTIHHQMFRFLTNPKEAALEFGLIKEDSAN